MAEKPELVHSEKFEAHSETYLLEIFAVEKGLKAEVTLNGNLCITATISTADIIFYTVDNAPVEELYLQLAAFLKSQISNKHWKKRYDASKGTQR
jgi:hypothetical protein